MNKKLPNLDIAKAIKNLRKQSEKFTQEYIGNRAGMRSTYISDLERGRYKNPTCITIAKLAKAFDMPLHEFIKYAENTSGGKKAKHGPVR